MLMFSEDNADLIEASTYNEAVETAEGNKLIVEAILEDALLECGISVDDGIVSEMYDLLSENLLLERSIVKLDKKAKQQLAIKKAAIVMAKENNDKNFKKLKLIYKMKKKYIDAIMNKWETKATIRVKKNKSNRTVAKLISNIKEKANSLSLKDRDLPMNK